jgi:hypothetical protein
MELKDCGPSSTASAAQTTRTQGVNLFRRSQDHCAMGGRGIPIGYAGTEALRRVRDSSPAGWRACRELRLELAPKHLVEFNPKQQGDQLAFVISMNLKRAISMRASARWSRQGSPRRVMGNVR